MQIAPISLAESDADRRSRLKITEPAELLYNHGAQLKQKGHFRAAIIAFRRAIGLSPLSGLLWNGIGAAYWDIGDYLSALHALNRARELGYDEPLLFTNYGLLYAAMGEFEKAEEAFAEATKRAPKDVNNKWNLAHTHLEMGDWKRGFEEYEIRIAHRGEPFYPKLPYPMWQGENLNDKTLFVHAEQGVGDCILFSRYLQWLKDRYPRIKIKLLVRAELVSLFWKFFDFVDLVPDNAPWPKGVHYACFLMSLAKHHGTTPDNVYPDPGLIRSGVSSLRFQTPASRTRSMKVGICWTGNPNMGRNHERSIPLSMLMELEENPGVQLYSLQFGPGQAEIAANGAQELVHDLVPLIERKGYIGTAAAMMDLDLVITCCTSVAHLAGALGVPCWVLLCQDPYWVWLREGDKSIWYPSVKLYRQDQPGDWGPVIDQVKIDLADRAFEFLTKDGATADVAVA